MVEGENLLPVVIDLLKEERVLVSDLYFKDISD